MPDYDPFARGPHPVGTRTLEFHDESRERRLPVDVWYPATESFRGQDFDDATRDRFKSMPISPEVSQHAVRDADAQNGPFSLVVFSHGFGGERRQSTHLCTHLASHGYVVAAMDHVGNTTADMMQMASSPPDPSILSAIIENRPTDASFVIDCMLAGDSQLEIDPMRVGMAGHSFGGWTTLVTSGADDRVRAAVPLAPAGGRSPHAPVGAANVISDALDMNWRRSVPTLYLAAEFDTLLPLDAMQDLLARTRTPARGFVLLNSDHFHFCDSAESTHDMFKQLGGMLVGNAGNSDGAPDIRAAIAAMKPSSELCPGTHAYQLTCGFSLAHMDAHLQSSEPATAFLEEDLIQVMKSRGVTIAAL